MLVDSDWMAPPHAALEALRTVRRLELAGSLTFESAQVHAETVTNAAVRYASPDRSLLDAAWELRHNISLYDAPYVVLAAKHGCALLTLDRRLATAARARAVTVIVPEAQES